VNVSVQQAEKLNLEGIRRLAADSAVTAGVEPVSIDSFLSRLCSDRQFLSAVSEHLLIDSNSVLRRVTDLPGTLQLWLWTKCKKDGEPGTSEHILLWPGKQNGNPGWRATT
jgi:hypothetical protein